MKLSKLLPISLSLVAIFQQSACLAGLEGEERVWNDPRYWPKVRSLVKEDVALNKSIASKTKELQRLGRDADGMGAEIQRIHASFDGKIEALEARQAHLAVERRAAAEIYREVMMADMEADLSARLAAPLAELARVNATFEERTRPFEIKIASLKRAQAIREQMVNDGHRDRDLAFRFVRQTCDSISELRKEIEKIRKELGISSLEDSIARIKAQDEVRTEGARKALDAEVRKRKEMPSEAELACAYELARLKAERKEAVKDLEGRRNETVQRMHGLNGEFYNIAWERARERARMAVIAELLSRQPAHVSGGAASASAVPAA